MPVNLRAINAELAKRGFKATIARGDGYFYFFGGEASDWPDRTVCVRTLHALTLEEWMAEFQQLAEKNRQLLAKLEPTKPTSARKPNQV